MKEVRFHNNTFIDTTMDYSKKTSNELIALCKEKQIRGYSYKKKQELIQLLNEHTANPITFTVTDVKKETNSIPYTPWTAKSKDIEFKSSNSGIGDGEHKVAAELDAIVLGQNSDYDMDINAIGPCDVKKLDDLTFNTGVKGRDMLRPIKNKLFNLLDIFRKIRNSSILTPDENSMLLKLEETKEISPDELCVSNISKINDLCTMLHHVLERIQQSFPKLPCNEILIRNKPSEHEISLYQYYTFCQSVNHTFPDEYVSYTTALEFQKTISHEYIITPTLLMESLNNLVSIFNGVTLIFVDDEKGYCIWKQMECIQFERITRGNPRFKVRPERSC
jgi:hypothetical protein